MEGGLGKGISWPIRGSILRQRDGVQNLGRRSNHVLEIVLIDVEDCGSDLVDRDASVTERWVIEARELKLELGG